MKRRFFTMPLVYKTDIMNALKDKGFTSYKLRHDKLLSESTLQKLRNQEPLAWKNLETLCKLLECQPADLIEYVED